MEIFGIICLVILLIVVAPALNFLGGWISGWIIKMTIGHYIVSGLALIGFNLPLDKFPLFFGTLALIASFFHTPKINTNKDKKG